MRHSEMPRFLDAFAEAAETREEAGRRTHASTAHFHFQNYFDYLLPRLLAALHFRH